MNIRTFVPSRRRLAALSVVLAAALGLAQGASADSVTRVFMVVVPPAQDQAFNEGIKDYEKCLHDHGSAQATIAYSAVTGDLSRYLFLEERSSWGGFDEHDAASAACEPAFVNEVLPHSGQAFSEIAEPNAKDTYMPGNDTDPSPMMWVNLYRVKAGQTEVFEGIVAKLAAAAAKTHWEAHFAGYDIEGSGQGQENFVLVWPNKSWADIGHDAQPSAKDMMDSVYGKKASHAMHDKYMAAIADQWTDAWSYQKDLSYIPGK